MRKIPVLFSILILSAAFSGSARSAKSSSGWFQWPKAAPADYSQLSKIILSVFIRETVDEACMTVPLWKNTEDLEDAVSQAVSMIDRPIGFPVECWKPPPSSGSSEARNQAEKITIDEPEVAGIIILTRPNGDVSSQSFANSKIRPLCKCGDLPDQYKKADIPDCLDLLND